MSKNVPDGKQNSFDTSFAGFLIKIQERKRLRTKLIIKTFSAGSSVSDSGSKYLIEDCIFVLLSIAVHLERIYKSPLFRNVAFKYSKAPL